MAASTLLAGDIAVIGYNTGQTDGNGSTVDTFRIVLLKPVGSGTVIYFTDRAWTGAAFTAAAGDGTITYTAGADLAAGTVIDLPMAGGFDLEQLGDAIYAFQGTDANTPVRFLTAIEIADGNTAFAGSLANTGLTAGVNAVAVGQDSAAYHGPTTEAFAYLFNAKSLMENINDATNWVGANSVGGFKPLDQPDHSGPYNTAADFSLWIAGSTGGTGIVSVQGDSTVNSGNVAYNLSQLYTDSGLLTRPQDIVFDTVHGKFFIADSNFGSGVNRVLQGNISDLLGNPSTTPTLTVLYSDTGTTVQNQINNLEVDVNNGIVYFNHGQRFEKVAYNTANQTPTILANFGAGSGNPVGTANNFADDFVIDFATGTVYISSHRVLAAADGDQVSRNYIYKITGLAPSTAAGALTFGGGQISVLPFNPDDDDVNNGITFAAGEGFPQENGTVEGLALSANGQTLYIATASTLYDNDSDGGFSGPGGFGTPPQLRMGGVYSYALTGNAAGNFASIYQPTDDGDIVSQTIQPAFGPQGLLDELEFDSATGHLYFTDTTGDQLGATNPSGDEGVWRVSITGGPPTYFANVNNINGLGPGSLFLNHAPTMTSTGAAATTTETAGAASGASSAAAPVATISITDIETASKTDQLAGALVRISSGLQTGATHQDNLTIGGTASGNLVFGTKTITYGYNVATGVMTLAGEATFANYESAINQVRFSVTGDNPTAFGAATTRTVAWSVSDGLNHSDETSATITVAGVNDAPVIVTGAPAAGLEDGAAVNLAGISVTDPDADAAVQVMAATFTSTGGTASLLTNVAGGIVAGNVTGNGTGVITVNATQAQINATLAAAGGLAFTPTANFNGAGGVAISVNDGGASGTGGAQAGNGTKTVNVLAANDAPVVGGDGTEALPATNEDVATVVLTNTVSALFAGQYSDTADQVAGGSSANPFAGVAVIANGSSAGTGQWQYYNGSTWNNIGAVSTAASKTFATTVPLRFLPATDYNGAAPTLTVKLVDTSGGALTNGLIVDTTTSGGTTPYSTGTVELSHGVTAVNDAPVIVGGPAVTLATIGENSAPGAGETVTSLFASHFSDAKDQVAGGSSANAFTGVAITANTATAAQGVYQYFSGGTWLDLPGVSTASAFVLASSTLVRFVPAANYSGTPPALIVHMVDDSSGAVTTGATADLTTTGGSTAFSAAMTLGITVTQVNDAPVAAGTASLAAVAEDTAAPAGASVATLFGANFSDPDVADTLAGVAISGNAATSQGVWQYFNGAWVTIGSPTEATAVVLAAGALIRFLPAANFNGPAPDLTAYLIDSSAGAVTTGAVLDVSVNGGNTRFSDNSVTLGSSVSAVNDTPVVPVAATTVGATEQTPAVLLGAVSVSDVDLDARNGGNGDYTGASFTTQRGAPNAADAFAFSASGLFTVSGGNLQAAGQTFATFTSTGGVLTVNFTSTGTPATTALANDVIRHIIYSNTSDAPPSSVALNYALNDGAPAGGQGAGGAPLAAGAVTVNITAVNDVHTGGVSITGTAAEDQVLTAVSTVVDLDGLGTLHYQWQRDVGGGFVNVGADQATYTLGDGDIGGIVRVVLYYTDAGGTVESATSAATAAITATNDAPTGGVSITGAATENQVLTADTSTLADSDGLGTLHYTWQRDTGSGFVTIGAPDQATYTLGDADVGAQVRVQVTYTDGQGFANSVTSTGTAAIAAVNDPHTGTATITGTATEDQVLTAVSTLADIDGLGTLHYQWQRDTGAGYVNVGTDQATYTLGDAEVGGVVRVVVSYTDGQGFAESATSAATASIANVNDAPTGTVAIAGTPTEGQTLTASNTLADLDGMGAITYQWKENGTNIAGATNPTLVLGAAQTGKTITVTASYTDGMGTPEAVTSAATAAVGNINDAPTGSVTISGAAAQASVLTAANTLADLDGLGPITYQWRSNGAVIAGAVGTTFTPGQAQVGTTITVTASYTDLQGTAESVTSGATAAVANVNDAPTGGVAIAGNKTVGSTLTASNTLADADGLGAIGYEWLRDGTAIPGATSGTYVLAGIDVGKAISVRASYIDGGGTPESATSVGITGEAVPTNPGGPTTPPAEPVSKLVIEAQRFDAPPVNGAAPKIQLTLVADSLNGEVDPDPSTAYLSRFGQNPGPDAGRSVANALGTLDFKAELSQAGNTETFSLIFDNSVAQNGFWVTNSKGHWVNLADPSLGGSASVTGTQMRLDFKITDGGEFDLDGVVNGSITGSGFVAMTNLSIIGHVPDSGDNFALF